MYKCEDAGEIDFLEAVGFIVEGDEWEAALTIMIYLWSVLHWFFLIQLVIMKEVCWPFIKQLKHNLLTS